MPVGDLDVLARHRPSDVLVVYAIEATVHAPTFEGVYNEIKKVLKPGGIVSCYS
jgi:predicted methyltransferase